MDSKGTQPHIYMHPFSPKLPSHPGCHITLSRVPCAVYSRSLLVIHFIYSMYMSIPNSLVIHFPHSSPLATIDSFSKSVSLFLFCKVHLCHFFLDSAYKGCHMIFFLLCQIYFTKHDNLYVHPCCCKCIILFFSMAE